MSKAKRWVPMFPGERRVWEIAATAGVIGGVVFVNVWEQVYSAAFPLSLAMLWVMVLQIVRDHRYFGWQSFAPARGWVFVVSMLASMGAVIWAIMSLTDRSLPWAALAGLLCAGITLTGSVLVQEGMRKDPRALRFPRSPVGEPVRL